MAYKTILVHLDKKEKALNRIQLAAYLAKIEGAHLIGASMVGISTETFREANIDDKDPALAAHLKFLDEKAKALVDMFNEEMRIQAVPSYEGRVVDGDAEFGICMQARYVDLLIIGLTDKTDPSPSVSSDFPKTVIVHAARPVLLVPPRYEYKKEGAPNVLISWNASKESRRALTDAIPLLKQAKVVDVATFNIESEPDMRDGSSMTDLAVYLARHGVTVHMLQPQKSDNVGQSLLELAKKRDSDLLVLGGYGHTRFREFLLGGVTRTILEEANLPVFMSH